jgi:hypothetical protein
LGLFSVKTSHPLSDEKERERVLRRLASGESLAALKEATDWFKSLSDAHGIPFAVRSALMLQIDNAAQRPARALGRVYLTTPHLAERDALNLWRASRGFWAQLGVTYSACLADFAQSSERPESNRVELTRLTVRLLRAYAVRLQWSQYRYWPVSDLFWQNVGRAYLYALDNGYVRREISVYPGDREQTNVEREYLRALVFQVSATDSLLPFEIEIAGLLIAHLREWFEITTEPHAGFAYSIDPERRSSPSRIVSKLEPSLSRVYFSTVGALRRLQQLQETLERGELPHDMEVARYQSPQMILPVVRHLAAQWAEQPRKREYGRYRARMQVTAVSGLDTIRRCLVWPALAQSMTKKWTIEDVSLGGFRARIPLEPEKQLRIGTLLGFQLEGSHDWIVGVVRRASRESETRGLAGVETLSKNAIAVTLGRDGPVDALLLDPPEEGDTVRLLLRETGENWEGSIPCAVLGTTFGLVLVELVERGADFQLVRCRVVESP